MQSVLQALDTEAAKFRTWADDYPAAERSDEWECSYDMWRDIYCAFRAYVQATGFRDWDQRITEYLLYLIARDNEFEALIKDIAARPDDLLHLAEIAVSSTESKAKWQIAVELGKLSTQTSQAERLLLRFAHNADEYVRRRAMMALADAGSTHVAALATVAWDTNLDWDTTGEFQQYPRMAALYSLR
jgi:hypothetical protein